MERSIDSVCKNIAASSIPSGIIIVCEISSERDTRKLKRSYQGTIVNLQLMTLRAAL